eukprot:CCRYP_004203-RA/>CCRYP_004203-RA protein AED:0.00 eAED:0.00 QI:80/1/1/1/0/0/2/107/78
MCTLSRNCRRLVSGLPRGGLVMVAKSPMVGGKSPVLSSLALREAEVTCSWLRKRRQPKMRCSFRVSKVVRDSVAEGVA